jgi:hypothetical protein
MLAVHHIHFRDSDREELRPVLVLEEGLPQLVVGFEVQKAPDISY